MRLPATLESMPWYRRIVPAIPGDRWWRLGQWLCVLGVAGFGIPVSAQAVYKSVGPDGRVVYSDQPPPGHRVVHSRTFDAGSGSALPASATEQLAKLKSLKPAAPAGRDPVLYSAAWCGYCQKAKAYLAGKGIAYREIDIDTPDGLAAFAQAGGGRGVPLLVAGERRVQGFVPAAYDELLVGRK